jgi:hypothetical protein
MINPTTVSMIRDIVAIFGVIAGFTYYVLTVQATRRNQKQQLEARNTQIFMQLYQELNDEESYKTAMELMTLELKDNDEYLQKYDSSVNLDGYAKRARIWYTYNSIGELLRRGTVEIDLLIRLQLDIQVVVMWEKWGDIIRATRIRENIPYLWEGFEYLYDELKKYRDSKGHTDIIITQPKPELAT